MGRDCLMGGSELQHSKLCLIASIVYYGMLEYIIYICIDIYTYVFNIDA